MAEAFLRATAGDLLEVHSAGAKPTARVHPLAIEAMDEIGLDLSAARPKSVGEFLGQHFHSVITVCNEADEVCPTFPGQVNRHHWSFDDPAKAKGGEEAVRTVFRRVRDEIRRVFEAYAAGWRDSRPR